MQTKHRQTHRQGQLYHFSIAGVDYTAFIWKINSRFHGRVEGNPHVPECSGPMALAVRDALQQWLASHADA